MFRRFLAAIAVSAVLAACSGGADRSLAPDVASSGVPALANAITSAATGNVVSNPGFETGSLSSWTSCGSVGSPTISTVQAHSGSYSALIGATSKPEVNGTEGICQTVTVPTGASLSFWVYEGTDDTIKYVDQEADVLSTSGTQLSQLYAEATSTNGWVEKTFSLGTYAGQTVQLYFGIKGNGYASDYVYLYLDDVSLTTTAAATASPSAAPSLAPSPAPSATAKPTASAKPTATATAAPTSTPTATPTAVATTAAFPCNNAQFNSDQAAFAAGTITADQPEDICGAVTQVLAAKKTSSGDHGYFYVELPSGYQIEIVSNLDAMAQASTDQPPAWPWVAVNQYVYVQGRYYYDSASSQGIDWTEDDTSSSWSHIGYVAVCTDSGTSCQKYW